MKMTEELLEVPVLIVGAGPAGLTMALLLRQYGIEALTINRYAWTANTPRAHYQNQRSIEILRELGLEAEVGAQGMPTELAQHVVWTETLAGVEFARIPTYMKTRQDAFRKASPCRSVNIAQSLLEPIMASAAMARGAAIRWNHELIDVQQDADGVTALIEDRTDARRYRVRCQYLVGADGARSRVAEAVGIAHTGQAGWGAAVNVWFKADLTRYCAHRPGFLYWTNRPGVDFWVGSGGFVNVKPWNEWVMSFMYDPAHGAPDLSVDAMSARVRALVGDDDLAVEILSVNPWQMNALVADRMRAGRVFIAGDAVHRHPPSGGLGSNTSMQDAYNLAWKLAAVLRSDAGEALLDSYEAERLPVAQKVVQRSMQNIDYFIQVARALGFEEGQSPEQGWRRYQALHEDSADGAQRRATLREALALQQYHFCAHGTELNTRYDNGALAPEASSAPSGSEEPAVDAELHYLPSTRPGASLPHTWVAQGAAHASTLDLCRPGRLTLLCGHGHARWREAAAQVAQCVGVPVDVVAIGVGLDWRDIDDDWHDLRQFEDGGCVLVRPDKVVAWRSQTTVDAEGAGAALLRAVRQVLSRPAA
ncbi:FAD-dependent monooxygenase [Pandoraea pnomenusa]|uniref:FAD-dependent monooxygenase n=1 Tax=Pandoraea pnomenusa TaxID=93220 RepID=UPI0033417636